MFPQFKVILSITMKIIALALILFFQVLITAAEGDLFEGDIVISKAEEEAIESGAAGAGIVGSHFRWPNRLIPYKISREYCK